MFDDYSKGKVYDINPLFYGEWDDKSSKLLLDCDQELQNIVYKLDKLDLSGIKSLKEHYESSTIEELTNKLKNIASLHNIYSPMIKIDNGYIPDFNSRYFLADFPFGLAIIKEFGRITNTPIPNIEYTLIWYETVTNKVCKYPLYKHNINCIEDIYKYYQTTD